MLQKLQEADNRYKEIEQKLTLPETVSNNDLYFSLIKEYNKLSDIVNKFRDYKQAVKEMDESLEIANDASTDKELRELAADEYKLKKSIAENLISGLKVMLMPKDPNDSRNVIVELRQGAGGEEAALFAYDLFRMYSMYATNKGFKIDVININETELGGIKGVEFSVIGEGAFSKFKFESGVHRVQRIPVTESNGKIQTSTVTVAVLPEVEAVEVNISTADIKIESCKSSGAGGQHINKTESAVRLTHLPTGIVIECDGERSQLQNKERAMKLLYAKLYNIKQAEQNDKIASTRKNQVGSGDRSEKIRTYNFPQSRVTDHRINKTIFNLSNFLNGNMDSIIDDLISNDTVERLKGDANAN